jgi:hypothetical protein
MLGFANASPRAAAALAESHTRHMRMARLLKGAGLADDEAKAPELLPLLIAARESASRKAGRKVSVKDVEDEDDEEVDRGIIAQAALPPGVPMCPPRVFLPRERTDTKRWKKWPLKQGEPNRSETDARIAEGDMLSVVMLSMDYSALTDKLAKAAEDEGDIEAAWALAKIGMAYRDAAYQDGSLRVDQVTLDLISKPVSEMYTRQNRMYLETVTVSPAGLKMLREVNKATIAACTKAAANKEAAVPHGFGDNGGSSEQPLSKRAKQRAASRQRSRKSTRANTNRPKEPQVPPPIRQAADSRPGDSNLPLKATGANMVWPNARRWDVGRVGSRRARDSSVEVWGERSARSRIRTISFTWDQAICEQVGGDGSYHRETIERSDLERAVSGARSSRAVCVPEFIVQNKDGAMRGVADLSHLSDHYDSLATKAETLMGFSTSLMPGDRMHSMDMRSGYNHFRLHPDMRKYFTVRIVIADGTERYFQYLVLPFGWSRSDYWFPSSAEILDYGQEDARLSCFELCRRIRDCSSLRPPCIIGRLSKSVSAFGCASFALWFDKAPFKECLGRWVPVSTTIWLCGGYSPRVVWDPGEGVGCDFELCPEVADDGSTEPQAREGGLSGKFYRQSSEYATGRARHGVPPQSPLRLRTCEDDGFDAFDFSWETMPDFHSYCAFIPSGFEISGILERSSQPAISPAYLARGVKTDCDHSYRRFYDGIWGDFSSWRTGGWS